jgi:hypothetical protein
MLRAFVHGYDEPLWIHQLYASGCDVNETIEEHPYHPVWAAARMDFPKMLDALLSLGANPYYCPRGTSGDHGTDDFEPLEVAVATHHKHCIMVLLDHGVRLRGNIPYLTLPIWTPLFVHAKRKARHIARTTWCAARKRCLPRSVCKIISSLVYGMRFELDEWYEVGELPKAAVVEMVDAAEKYHDKSNIISFFCSSDFEYDIPELLHELVLVRGYDPNTQNDSPLRMAVCCGKPSMLRALLWMGAKTHKSVLSIAYSLDHRHCAEVLLDAGYHELPAPEWVEREFFPRIARVVRAAVTLAGIAKRHGLPRDMRRELVRHVMERRWHQVWRDMKDEEKPKSWSCVLLYFLARLCAKTYQALQLWASLNSGAFRISFATSLGKFGTRSRSIFQRATRACNRCRMATTRYSA